MRALLSAFSHNENHLPGAAPAIRTFATARGLTVTAPHAVLVCSLAYTSPQDWLNPPKNVTNMYALSIRDMVTQTYRQGHYVNIAHCILATCVDKPTFNIQCPIVNTSEHRIKSALNHYR